MNFRILFSPVLLFAFAGTSCAQTFDKEKLDRYFDRLSEKNKAMGTFVISRAGQVIYTRSIGYAMVSPTANKPLTASSRFRIGSITKMYTAVMVFQLAEEGKLSLADTLAKFFPQIPNAGKITIQQILTHYAGIHDALIDPAIRTRPKNEPIDREDILKLITKGKPDFEPGTKYSYSNSGYALLGLLIEKLSGKTYDQVLKEKIADRIGLTDTYIATGTIDTGKNESLTYRYTGGWQQQPETHPGNLFGGGFIISTPADMSKFIAALFEGRLISHQHLELMKTVQPGDVAGMMEPFQFAGRMFYGHTGGADNYGSWLAYLPQEKIAVAYATNAKVYPVGDIMKGITEIFYNRPFEIPTFESIAISMELLDKYAGVYSTTEAPVKFTVTRNGTTLLIQPPGQSAAPLEALSQETFKVEGTTGITFTFDAVKKQMTMKRQGMERVFTKEN